MQKNNDTTTLLITGRKESYYQNTVGSTMGFEGTHGSEEGEGGSDEERMPSPQVLFFSSGKLKVETKFVNLNSTFKFDITAPINSVKIP